MTGNCGYKKSFLKGIILVILIGGISYTGKTLLSYHLMKKHYISYLSIDHLKMGLYRTGKNCGFTPVDNNYNLGKKLWPLIKGIIMTNIENKQNIIIEGCYLLPELMNDFEKKYIDQIISIFIVFSEQYLLNNFESIIIKNRNVIEERNYKDSSDVQDFIQKHNKLKKQCASYNTYCFEIISDYESEIRHLHKYIDEQINKHKNKIIRTI